MTDESNLDPERGFDELPVAYRAAVEAILAEHVPDIDLQRIIALRGTEATGDSRRFIETPSVQPQTKRIRQFAVAAAIAGLILLSLELTSSSMKTNFAFAQVQEQLNKVQSVQYTEVRKDLPSSHGMPALIGKNPPQVTSLVMVLGTSLQRKDVTVKAGDKLPDGCFWALQPGHYIDIYDARQGKSIVLYPEKKTFQIVGQLISLTDDGKVKTEKIEPDPKIDFYAMIRQTPVDPVKRLPEQSIGGKKVIGFVSEEQRKNDRGVDTFRHTFWVDPQTKLPIRIETTMRSTDPQMGETDWDISDLVFDAPLDPKLFSAEPPTGYSELSASSSDRGKASDGN
jgi:hypothetical protein